MPVLKKSELDLFIIGRVKKMREDRKISQAVLATQLNVSDAFIGQIENPNSRSKYNIYHLNELAKIFNCSIKDFIPDDPI